jgi:hypothetical protein
MMSESVQTFDPYAEMPFLGYKSPSGEPEKYLSIMHFVEAEKLRDVDNEYRSYILGLRDRDDFILETAGIASQWEPSPRWAENRLQGIYAAIFMQLVQNKDTIMPILMNEDLQYPSVTIKQARDSLVSRVTSAEPWRRVLFLGQREDSDLIPGILDHIFTNRNPDEIFVLDEPSISTAVDRYSHDNYIPIRIIGTGQSENVSADWMDKLSHIFLMGSLDSASAASKYAFEMASSKGTKIHQVELNG